MAKSVFFSFHYERDVHRIQLVRNINALVEGQQVLEPQDWESVRRGGDTAIKNWIDKQMAGTEAVIVLIGQETATRPWVIYEIEKAWADKRPLLGIYIHGVSSLGTTDTRGPNPFDAAAVGWVPVFDPTVGYGRTIDSKATYNKLRDNIVSWSSQGVVKSGW